MTVAVPLKVPAALGVNANVRVAFCPAPIETGRVGLVIAKYWVETEAALIVSEVVPVLVAEIARDLLFPAATLPKLSVLLENDNAPTCGWPLPEPPELTPWQAINRVNALMIESVAAALEICLVEWSFTAFLGVTKWWFHIVSSSKVRAQ